MSASKNSGLASHLQELIRSSHCDKFCFPTGLLLLLSLGYAALCAGYALDQAFARTYVIHDDARQHVFWMQRFVDSGLFQNDAIADYFQTVAPIGYSSIYRAAAMLGLDPLLLSKLFPMVLGLITTLYFFGLCLNLLPSPIAALISSILLNQSLWLQEGLVSATPRAFLYPLFIAFLYYLARGSLPACLATIGLQGLFYPSIAFISAGVVALRLVGFQQRRFGLSRDRRDYWLCGAGLAILSISLAIHWFATSGLGPVVTGQEGRNMPELSAEGRIRLFREGFWEFWINGPNTGILRYKALVPFTICLGVLLPLLIRYRKRFPLAQDLSGRMNLFPQVAATSVVMFLAAHLLLFRLYLPSRYTAHTFRILLSLAAGIAIAVLLDALFRWQRQRHAAGILFVPLAGVLFILLVIYPGSPRSFIHPRYILGTQPTLYEFFSQQPKDITIASLANEASNLPTFAGRSILVSREHSLPFHKDYIGEMRKRAAGLIEAQYTPRLSELQQFVRNYRVDLLMIDRDAYTTQYIADNRWLMQFQAADNAIEGLSRSDVPALKQVIERCSAFETEDFIVISAECVLSVSP